MGTRYVTQSYCPGPMTAAFDDPTLRCPRSTEGCIYEPPEDQTWREYCDGCRAGAEGERERSWTAGRDEE